MMYKICVNTTVEADNPTKAIGKVHAAMMPIAREFPISISIVDGENVTKGVIIRQANTSR